MSRDIHDLVDRINSFEKMQDGWLDGCGKAPEYKWLKIVHHFVLSKLNFLAEFPCAFPTEEGGVLLEHFPGFEKWIPSLEFNPEREVVSLSCTKIDPGEIDSSIFVESKPGSDAFWTFVRSTFEYMREDHQGESNE